ncbi:extensin [Streptomyces sp. H39-S7]|uniref:extensin n=1 Tax=Streptomyces sp. H39-S7 TaxID=3004357 RepID=UPI0022AFAC0A|nr:extensin [Streptomyces sp. H39-S7]MCZ4122310.1 extensin [Streptomyces sp. H39-S7]
MRDTPDGSGRSDASDAPRASADAPTASVARPVRSAVVSLAPTRPVPAAALPVQRAAPAVPAGRPSPAAAPTPARAAAPATARVSAPRRATSVAVQRGGDGGGSSDKPAPSVTSQLKPRELKEDQVAELVHRLIGPMTRLLRTELRLDRERIGKLRDPRH